MGKQPWPLMKHCTECGFYHGVNYDCTADPKQTAESVVPFADIEFPPPPPMLPQPLEATFGALYVEGPDGKPIKLGDVSHFDVGIAGGLLAAIKAKLRAAPTADVADAFFLAFVEQSRRTPVCIDGGLETLRARLTANFGGA